MTERNNPYLDELDPLLANFRTALGVKLNMLKAQGMTPLQASQLTQYFAIRMTLYAVSLLDQLKKEEFGPMRLTPETTKAFTDDVEALLFYWAGLPVPGYVTRSWERIIRLPQDFNPANPDRQPVPGSPGTVERN